MSSTSTSSNGSSSSTSEGSTSRLYAMHDQWHVTAVATATGIVVERYAYEAFGISIVLSPSFYVQSVSLFGWETRFGAYRFDEESGLYCVRYRYLNPWLGRWASRDPIGYFDGINIYGYSDNRTTSWVDPTGLLLREVLATALLLAVAYAVFQLIERIQRAVLLSGYEKCPCPTLWKALRENTNGRKGLSRVIANDGEITFDDALVETGGLMGVSLAAQGTMDAQHIRDLYENPIISPEYGTAANEALHRLMSRANEKYMTPEQRVAIAKVLMKRIEQLQKDLLKIISEKCNSLQMQISLSPDEL